jgi:hypothetical protein
MKTFGVHRSGSEDRSVVYVLLAMAITLVLGSVFLVFSIEVVEPGALLQSTAGSASREATAGKPATDAASNSRAAPAGGAPSQAATQGARETPAGGARSGAVAPPTGGARPVQGARPAAGTTTGPATTPGAGAVPDAKASPEAQDAATATESESSRARIVTREKTRDAARWAGLLWAFACCAAGAFVGFIFGIPRSLSSDTARTTIPAQKRATDAAPDKAAASKTAATDKDRATREAERGTADSAHAQAKNDQEAPSSGSHANGAVFAQSVHTRAPSTAVNTNLEQISDWLTKIIVGVSLVNSDRVGRAMMSVANEMASSFGGPGSRSLALATLTYFSVIGLLGGYLLTRLFLQRAFEALASPSVVEQRTG